MLSQKDELMLFNYGTVYKTDYHYGEIKPSVKTVYKERQAKKPPPKPDYKYVHTATTWKTDPLPFDTFIKKNPILHMNPGVPQEPYSYPVDHDREKVMKTRPRLVICPMVSMDDVKDPETRRLLIEDFYSTDSQRALREAVVPGLSVRAPFPGYAAASDCLNLEKYKPNLVSEEWRMETISWDNKQLRGYCDPTKEFWLARKLERCRACEESDVVRDHRKMLRERKQGK